MVDFGTDLIARDDLDPGLRTVTGTAALRNTLYRMVAPRLVRLSSRGISPASTAAAQADLASAIEADERVSSVSVALDFTRAAFSLVATISVQTAAGPFDLIVGIQNLQAVQL